MKTNSLKRDSETGSTLVVTIAVVATLLVLLGVAVEYSTQISRSTQRSRKTALAMEIADGHLETLFTQWRNTYRTTWTTTGTTSGGTDKSLCGTNFFYTAMYSPAPAPTPIPLMSPSATPPIIPLPSPSNFSTSAYSVTQYRIQGVDPMITLDANDNALVESGSSGNGNYVPMSTAAVPPSAYGPNSWQYSYFYLAAVDITVPALAGNVTAKVRRVFEKKFDQPWTYAMFYVGDLELQPTTPLTITGPVHTNSGLYVGTSNFTAGSGVEYGSDFVNGYSPKDPRYPGSGFTAPNFAKSSAGLAISDSPPAQVSPYLPFGWNLKLNSGTGGAANDDSYHEIIERPVSGVDPLANVRYYSQAGWRLVINVDRSVTITRVDNAGSVTTVGGNEYNQFCANNGNSNGSVLGPNQALYDGREGGAVGVTNVDISQLVSNLNKLSGWTGLLYLADAAATIYKDDGTVKTAGTAGNVTVNGLTTSTTKRAFRLINAQTLPSAGLTIVSENPVYIQGNYNTGGTPPSNSGNYTSPTASGYTRKPAAIAADAITVLSSAWSDSTSSLPIISRVAANTTVNAALVAGIVPSNGSVYSGGGENFIRFLEDWSTRTFCYYGSMVQLYRSNQAIGTWNGNGTVYSAPSTSKWFYDDTTFSSASPPGNLQIAAYLQQQRWYQVY